MKTQNDIQFELNVPVSPELAYTAISKPREWWIPGIDGETSALGGSFTADFGDNAFVRFTVTQAQPGRRYLWHVEDCFLPWFENKTEWTGTDVIFDIAPTAEGSVINMVHRGLTPEVECYEMCNSGWEGHILTGLRKLIMETASPVKLILGNHTAVTAARSDQDSIRRFYRDVLGCKINVLADEVDRFQLDNVHFCIVYRDSALDKSDFLKALYLELKTDKPEEMREKILAFGVTKLDVPDVHLYFQAPGGQVFRLVGIDEDLSVYEESHSAKPTAI